MRIPFLWKTSTVISSIGAIVIIAPFLYMLVVGGMHIVPAANDFLFYAGSTLPLLALTLAFALILAYGNALFLFYHPKANYLLLFLILPLSFPTYIMAFNWAMLWDGLAYLLPWISRSSIKSLLGLSMVLALCLFPYVLLPLHLFLKTSAKQMLAQGFSLGIAPKRTWLKVILPLSAAPITLGLALVAYELLNDYGAAKYYGINTLTTGIFKTWFGKGNREEALALSLLLLAIVFLFKGLGSWLRKRTTIDKTSNTAFQPKISKGAGLMLRAVSYFTLTLGLFAPFVGMVYGLIFDWEKQNFALLAGSAFNSFQVALAATLVTIVLLMGLLFAKSLLQQKIPRTLHNILASGYSIPGAVIACGVLGAAWLIIPSANTMAPELTLGLYNSVFLLTLGMSFKLYAAAVPAANNGWMTLGTSQIRAIKAFLPFKTFPISTRILKPQLLPFYAAGALFVFIDAVKELPLTLILRPFNFDTLATKAYNYVEDEYLFRAAPYSLVITLLCALGIIVFNRINRS